jgi:peptide/nickel transport system ATP-binding protein
MYAGEVVESAPVVELFESPQHPYTQGLLQSIPGRQEGDRLSTIEGEVPTPTEVPTECRFAPRCPKAFEECQLVHPMSVSVREDVDHTAACLLYPEQQSREEAVDWHRELNERRETGPDPGGDGQ